MNCTVIFAMLSYHVFSFTAGKVAGGKRQSGSIIAITPHGCEASPVADAQPPISSHPLMATDSPTSASSNQPPTNTPSLDEPPTLFCDDSMLLDSPQPSPILFDPVISTDFHSVVSPHPSISSTDTSTSGTCSLGLFVSV